MATKAPRQSNFELLRIVAMLLIILHHFARHTLFQYADAPIDGPAVWHYFIAIGGQIGVNVFMLITGYFLVKSTKSSFLKIAKLWGQLFFYSILINAIFVISGRKHAGGTLILQMLTPVSSNVWWFASAYTVIYLLHPYLNRFLTSLDKRDFQKFLLVFGLIICIIPTFFSASYFTSRIAWLVFVYFFGCYIRLHKWGRKISTSKYIFLLLGSTAITFAITLLIRKFNPGHYYADPYFFQHANTLSMFITSLALFMIFSRIKIPYSRFINTIAATTFGIYLLHDHTFVREFIWREEFFNSIKYQSSLRITYYSIAATIIVFIACCIIDLIRIYTVEKLYLFILNKYAPILCRRATSITDKLIKKTLDK